MQNTLEHLTRADWIRRLFGDGVPLLWCPPLTHYGAQGGIDVSRIQAHLRSIAPWVKGLLVPGSTGDGWELTSEERERVIEVALQAVRDLNLRLLIGALHPSSSEARKLMDHQASRLRTATPVEDDGQWLAQNRVCGFAVCPPRGSGLSQGQIDAELSSILDLGLPTALYQLPQVTENEMSSEVVSSLAQRFANFILFKDTSGKDAVAQSGADLHGVFLVRGMEGDYERWLKPTGGPYDGFLLSAANCFAEPLHRVIQCAQAGLIDEARSLSQRITDVIAGTFAAVTGLPEGNVFANGGKALDHFFAHGPKADRARGPRLHSGRVLPPEMLDAAGTLLTRHELMPGRGYLE
jgi:dihydrodipicolinate synthase/N-acetylneuraminate lyase